MTRPPRHLRAAAAAGRQSVFVRELLLQPLTLCVERDDWVELKREDPQIVYLKVLPQPPPVP